MTLLTFMWLFSQVQAPVIPNGPAIFAEDRQGQVYLLVDTQPRTVLVWNGEEMAKASAANSGEVTLIRAGREMLALNSSVFPGQMTRDQHVNGWRLARDPQNPTTSRIEVRPAGTATWRTPLDPEAVPADEYQTLVADEVGYVWISKPKSVLCLDPRKPKDAWTWTAQQPVTALGLSPSGRALAGLANGELHELGRGPKGSGIFQPYTVRQLPAKPIRAIHTDGEGSVWVVVEKAVYRAAPPADAWQRHWRSLARRPVGNHDIFSGQLDGKLFVFGGMGNYGYPAQHTCFNDLFSPPGDITLWAAICGAYQDEMWIMGGNTDRKLSFIWSPKNNAWRSGPALPTPLGWTSAQEVDGRLIITPGGTSTKQLDDFIFTDTVYELRPVRQHSTL